LSVANEQEKAESESKVNGR